MQVKELIMALSLFDPESEVIVTTLDDTLPIACVRGSYRGKPRVVIVATDYDPEA